MKNSYTAAKGSIRLFVCTLAILLPTVSGADEFAAMTWPQIAAATARTDLAIIPVGATEQTGPHNPAGSDHFIAEAVARRVGEATHVLVTPTVAVGISAKHRQFPGTLWVPRNVFYDYVKYQVLSLAEHGITKVLFINGHGGNDNALFDLTGDLRRNHHVFAAVAGALPEDSPLITTPADISHGGWAMTSVGLYLYADLVDLEGARNLTQRAQLGDLVLSGENRVGPEGGPFAKFDADAVDLTDNGILGAAGLQIVVEGASAEKGKQLLEPRIKELIRLVESMAAADAADLMPKSDRPTDDQGESAP